MPGKKQIKGKKQLIDLTETTDFLSEQFHEFEADRKLKEEIKVYVVRDQFFMMI